MTSFGEANSALSRELVALLADPAIHVMVGADLEVAVGSRNDVLQSVVSMLAVVVPAGDASIMIGVAELERFPAAALTQMLTRLQRPATNLSPSDRQLGQPTDLAAASWQRAARQAFLAADHLLNGDTDWIDDPASAWHVAAELADIAEALAVLDGDLSRVAAISGQVDYAQRLAATAGTGLRAAAAETARTARSGTLDDGGQTTSSRANVGPHPAAVPVAEMTDLPLAQVRVAAQLNEGATPGPVVLGQIAIGQARAHLSATRILHAAADGDPARQANYREAAAACHARANNLADVAAATADVASLRRARGDLRAVQQTGEILRLLTRSEVGLTSELGVALAPQVLAWAREGAAVIAALDRVVAQALDKQLYLVPDRTESRRVDRPWIPAHLLDNPPTLLEQTSRAALLDAGVKAAIERTGRELGAWGAPPYRRSGTDLRAAVDQRPRVRPDHPGRPTPVADSSAVMSPDTAQQSPGRGAAQKAPEHVEAAQAAWRAVVDDIDPRITSDPAWPALAATIERAHASGFNVGHHLRHLGHSPLPDDQPAAELQYRLIDAFPPAVGLPDVGPREAPLAPRPARRAAAPPVPPPATHGVAPPVTPVPPPARRGGPRR